MSQPTNQRVTVEWMDGLVRTFDVRVAYAGRAITLKDNVMRICNYVNSRLGSEVVLRAPLYNIRQWDVTEIPKNESSVKTKDEDKPE